jgi:hypothetical protein
MSNIIIYADGLFAVDDSHLSDLINSGVNTIMLWSLHVHANADLFYNDTLLVNNGKVNFGTGAGQINPNLPSDLQKLRAGGVTNIMFSIGSGGSSSWEPDDFKNIQALLNGPGRPQLTRNFTALAQALGLDGFDYDCEEDDISVNTITTLTQMLTPMARKKIISFCPYGVPSENFWLQCMSAIFTGMNQSQPVKWWNLQVYGGADPASWIQEMRDYIKSNPIGVTNPNSFILPGLEASSQPSGVQQQFAQWQRSGLALQGGFIWNLSAIYDAGSTPKAFVQAINAGLAGQAQSAA